MANIYWMKNIYVILLRATENDWKLKLELPDDKNIR